MPRFLPAALELSLTASEPVEQERAELERHGPQRRERAAYEVERAARKSHAVEPEHRLVARTLERAWEEKLAAKPQLEEEYHRFVQHKPRRLLTKPSGKLFAAWRRIFPRSGLPRLPWLLTAKRSFEKRVARVIVDVQGNSERVKVRIEWIGGGHTEGIVLRPEGSLSDLSTYPQICQQVQVLTEAGWAAIAIAQALSKAGYCSTHATVGFGVQTKRRDTTTIRSESASSAYQVS